MKQKCLEELRETFKSRRDHLGLSMAKISVECGVKRNALHRFYHGNGIEVESAVKLGAWLGITPSEIFSENTASVNGGGSAMEGIRSLILKDEFIPEKNRQRLLNWFEATYKTFAGTGDANL